MVKYLLVTETPVRAIDTDRKEAQNQKTYENEAKIVLVYVEYEKTMKSQRCNLNKINHD